MVVGLSSLLSVFILWAFSDVSPYSPLSFVWGGFSSSLAGWSFYSATLLLLVVGLVLIYSGAVLLEGVLVAALLLPSGFDEVWGV